MVQHQYPKSLEVVVIDGGDEHLMVTFDGDFDVIMEEVEEYLDDIAAGQADHPDEVGSYPEAVLVRDADTGELWIRWLPAEMVCWHEGCINRDWENQGD